MWWSSTCACGSLSGSNGASEQERGGARVSGACLTRGRLTSIGASGAASPPPLRLAVSSFRRTHSLL